MKAAVKTLMAMGLVLLATVSSVAQAEAVRASYSSVELVSEVSSVKPGETFTLGLIVTPDAGWHNYWMNPGDAGKEMKIRWKDLPEGVTVGDFVYEIPHVASMGGVVTYGYSEQNTITMDVTVPAGYGGDALTMGGKATYLTCDEGTCVMQNAQVSITLPVGDGAINADNIQLFNNTRAHQPTPVDWSGSFTTDAAQSQVSFEVEFLENGASEFYIWPVNKNMIAHTLTQDVTLDGGVLKATFKAGKRLKKYDTTDLMVTYTDTNGKHKAKFVTGVNKEGGAAQSESEAAAVASSADAGDSSGGAGEAESSSAAAADSGEEPIGFFWAMLLAFGGGLVLNLMPCVLPVLSLKLLSLVKMGDSHQSEVRSSGIYYTIGVLVSFLIMAGIVIAIKAAGDAVSWGFQLTNPIFVLAMVLLMVLIGMNLLGAFEFGTSMMNVGSDLTSGEQHSKKSSFWTGVLAVVVATPCTAPMMAPALGYAFTLPWYGALVIFVGLGFGLAFPYLLVAFVPKARAIVPNPGPWMTVFKTVLAFPMFATAAWLIWVLKGTDAMLWAIWASLLVALAAWAWGRIPMANRPNAWRVTAAVMLAGVVFLGFGTMERKEKSVQERAMAKQMRQGVTDLIAIIDGHGLDLTEEQKEQVQLALASTGGEIPYTEKDLMKVLDEGTPVFAYFTADWCVSCKANEKTALHREETTKFFEEQGIKVFVGDDTDGDPEIAKILELYKQPGVPLYLYFEPGDSLTEAYRLPQILPTPSTIIDGIKNSRG